MRPFNPALPSIPTPVVEDDRDPDEIDRALVEALTSAIQLRVSDGPIYVCLRGIARGPVPRARLDPVRARAKAIAEGSGWHVEVDGRSGGLWLTPRE